MKNEDRCKRFDRCREIDRELVDASDAVAQRLLVEKQMIAYELRDAGVPLAVVRRETNEKSCYHCSYFEIGYGGIGGACKRRAPVVSTVQYHDAEWPHVAVEEWCGEFERRPDHLTLTRKVDAE